MLTAKHVDEARQEALLGSLTADYRSAELEPVDRAILDYAVKLTRSPSQIVEEDVAAMRNQGLDDRAIHDICAIAAYYAFVNRIADGLGVELEG